MSFQLRLALKGNLKLTAKASDDALSKAVTRVIRNKTRLTHKNMAKRIERAPFRSGAGRKVARDLGSGSYPRGRNKFSTRAYGEIYSKAGKRAQKGAKGRGVPLIDVFQDGAEIRPGSGRWLAIPTEAGKRLAGGARNRTREISPQSFKGGALRKFKGLQFIKSRGSNTARLVLKAKPDVTVFILVRSATIRKKYDLKPVYNKAVRNVSELIARNYDKELAKELKKVNR